MRWSDSPLVRLGRDGEWFELGRDPDASPALHLWGSEGLGLAPVDIAKSDRITSDGSIVRGVRYTDREVFLPVLLEAESALALNGVRDRLYSLLAPDLGPVEVQLEIPTGEGQAPELRSICGYLTDGLDGAFGEGFYGSWQKLGLTFDCPDPWWLGPDRIRALQVAAGTKPFLSQSVPFFPVVLAPSNVVGAWDITVQGDGEVWPTWEITGPGRDLLIESDQGRIFIQGEFPSTATRIQTDPARITPDRWADLSLDSRLFSLRRGANQLKVSMVGANADTTVRLVYRERYRKAI